MKLLPATCILFSTTLLSAQSVDIAASFDTTIDFWGGVVNSNQATAKQMWASNSGSAPNASEEHYQRFLPLMGPVVKFDLSGVAAEMVNDPNFEAVLDVMFHGFAADRNGYIASGAPTPAEFESHSGDGVTNMLVFAMISDAANSMNRWLANSTAGSLLNWDGSVPTSFALATEAAGNFGPANHESEPRATTAFIHGWSATPAVENGTRPNLYGELTWDITSLVRDWVNGSVPNNGLLITTDPATSYGEQINMLTMESDDRPAEGISAPGDAAPMLRLRIKEVVEPPQPTIVHILVDQEALKIRFATEIGVACQVQSSATMAEGSWQNFGTLISGTGEQVELPVDAPTEGEPAKFYRVVLTNE